MMGSFNKSIELAENRWKRSAAMGRALSNWKAKKTNAFAPWRGRRKTLLSGDDALPEKVARPE
jgi:hypothetical protein